jgi:hypothetical protein
MEKEIVGYGKLLLPMVMEYSMVLVKVEHIELHIDSSMGIYQIIYKSVTLAITDFVLILFISS